MVVWGRWNQKPGQGKSKETRKKKNRNKRNTQIKKIFGQESPNTKTNQMSKALRN